MNGSEYSEIAGEPSRALAEPQRRATQPHRLWSDVKRGLHVTPALTYLDWALATVLALLMFCLCIYQADTVSLWYDEAWSYGIATAPLTSTVHYYFARGFSNMMAYHLFLHGWLGLSHLLHIPPDELYMRLPSAIAIALSVAVLYLFGRRFFGRVAGLVAALAYMLNGIVLQDAQQVRAYAPELLLAILSWYALAVALESSGQPDKQRSRATRGWWVLYSAVATLAIYTHLFMTLNLAAQALAVGFLLVAPGPWRKQARFALKAFVTSCVAIIVLSAPILTLAIIGGSPNTWVPVPTPKDLPPMLLNLTGGSAALALSYLSLGFVASGLLVAALAKTPLMSRLDGWTLPLGSEQLPGKASRTLALAPVRAPASGISLLVFWAAGTLLLSYIVSQKAIGEHFFYYRYENVTIPAICLLIGVGVSSLRWRVAQAVAVIALLALLASVPGVYYQHAQSQDFRTPSLWLKAHYQSGDGIVCTDGTSCSIPMDYYLGAYPPSAAQFDPDSPGAFFWATRRGVASDVSALPAYSAAHQRVFLVVFRPASGSPLSASAQSMKEWYDAHYALLGSRQTTTESVYLYNTASPLTPASQAP
ncbi:MAG TPA: glycosyltransferase family 39 protein [Ktedonobacterales bacterium]|nr:glycosyltransferase family 39 protein [Ktedonobacterales bacterium]